MFHRPKNDFRLSIITLLGISGLVGITPFAVLRFMQGNLLAGVVDSAILGGIATSMAYAWLTGDTRRTGLVMAIISSYGAVVVGSIVGDPGLFWLYPCLVTTFFLVGPRIAVGINLSAILAMMVVGLAFSSQEQMWSFSSTAVVVSVCAYVFAHRNHSQELDVAAANAERSGLPYALVLLDIDHFKKINDEYGHGVGDDVLTELVALLESNTRRSDQLFRYGGEEFVLLLPGVDGVNLRAVMNNLQQVLRKYMKHPGGPVTASFGVALLGHGESVDSWLARADNALYTAKETGRDRIVYAEEIGQLMPEPVPTAAG
jgi:diguanylate cyclase (GGDEF)-like protein